MAFFKKFFAGAAVILGVIILLLYLFFRVQLINPIPFLVILSIILFIAELHTIFHLFGMFYSLWPRKYAKYERVNCDRNLQINIFICVCGEPAEIVRKTILGAKEAAEYYRDQIEPFYEPRVIVLNDGLVANKDNWQEIVELSENLGIEHITRTTPGGFKAGNLNNGLANYPTQDPHNTIDVVFDSDFVAKKEFLTEITKPFIDKKVDFVQSPQRYQNEETWVAQAAAAHQIFFFDYICPAKAEDNALFLCGTNFAIRRKALEDVGGVDERFITEDYSTSLNLHLSGKKGVFINKVLAEGIAPSTLKAYFSQQQRWSKGNFDVTLTYLKDILFGPLTFKQKFHYLLSATYYLIGLRDFMLMLAPLPFLFFGVSLIKPNTLIYLLLIYSPLLIYNFVLYSLTFRHPIKSLVLDIISFPVFIGSLISSLIRKNLGFIVTIKKYEKESIFSVYRVQLLVLTLLSAGLFYSLYFIKNFHLGTFINYFWAIFNVTFLTLGFYLIFKENYKINFLEVLFFKPLQTVVSILFSILRISIPPIVGLLIILTIFNKVYITSFANNLPKLVSHTFVKEELLIPEQGVYYGYHRQSLNTHLSEPAIKLLPDEQPSLAMYYQDWGGKKEFNTKYMQRLSDKGVVPVVTWEPWDPDKWDPLSGSLRQIEYSPRSITEGDHDKYIRQWARGAAAYKKPFFLRLAHEMNGNWYPWGNVNDNTPEDYKQMWRHVYRIFQEEGADNVIWVWSPNNTDEYGETDSVLDYYPGDEYVDWVGFSGFNFGLSSPVSRWNSFYNLAYPIYKILVRLDKPIMVGETSSVSKGGDKTDWFEQTINRDIPRMQKIKAVIFYDENFKTSDFRLSENMDTEYVFKDGLAKNSYYLKQPQIISNPDFPWSS